MRARPLAALSAVMYFVSVTSFCCLVGIDILPDGRFSHFAKFITAFLVFICGYAATAIRCVQTESSETAHRIMRRTLIFLFAAYLLVVADFTLIDNSFGRKISNIFTRSPEQISEYLKNNTNLIPFATVRLFIRGWRRGALSFSALAENLMGNLAVFIPFAFFIPLLFGKFRKAGRFFALISAVVVAVEILQAVLLTGSSDIDDYILNVLGATAAFFLFRSKPAGGLLSRLTFGVWEGTE